MLVRVRLNDMVRPIENVFEFIRFERLLGQVTVARASRHISKYYAINSKLLNIRVGKVL
jgi:hypothetical protein